MLSNHLSKSWLLFPRHFYAWLRLFYNQFFNFLSFILVFFHPLNLFNFFRGLIPVTFSFLFDWSYRSLLINGSYGDFFDNLLFRVFNRRILANIFVKNLINILCIIFCRIFFNIFVQIYSLHSNSHKCFAFWRIVVLFEQQRVLLSYSILLIFISHFILFDGMRMLILAI